MTTYVSFAPIAIEPFGFQATLDGVVYQVLVTWNLFGQRWYVNIYDLSGTLVWIIAMIGSPGGADINLALFTTTSTLVFRTAANQFEISP